jgi:hypothetical protein
MAHSCLPSSLYIHYPIDAAKLRRNIKLKKLGNEDYYLLGYNAM